MKKLIVLFTLIFLVMPVFCESGSVVNNNDSNISIIIVVVSIIHIILTFCIYKMKGPYFACFYFFLAPVALAALLLFATKDFGNANPNNKNDITITHRNQCY